MNNNSELITDAIIISETERPPETEYFNINDNIKQETEQQQQQDTQEIFKPNYFKILLILLILIIFIKAFKKSA